MRVLVSRMKCITRIGLMTLALTFLALGVAAQPPAPDKPKEPDRNRPKVGLIINEPAASKGYTLLAPSFSTNTYLMDMEGRVVQTWKSNCNPGQSAYLLENGNLLRTGQVPNPPFFGGGAGGRIQEFTWDGKLIWDYTCSTPDELQHHDALKLPNGNVLINMWVKKTPKEAIAAGRRPETVGSNYLLSSTLREVKPTGKTTGKVVWEWHAWDHLIQEFDAKKAHHGEVGAHPELIDLNFGSGTIAAMVAKPEELAKLRAIGYVGGAGRRGQRPQTDWLHVNGLSYNPELDQILLTVHEFSEIWAIDHSTTTAEAASHSGGHAGKGGDIIYRWGNPSAYRAGTTRDQKLFGPHNGHWIARGLPGAGHILIFNNGMRRTGGAYSTIEEIVPPVDKGRYEHSKGKAFGPDKSVWTYTAPKRTDFYAPLISGSDRLANGNTLICSGPNGTLFEVTPKGETVWKFINPTKSGPPMGGRPPFGGPPMGGNPFGGAPKLGQIVPAFLQGILSLSDEQKKQLGAIEKELGEKLGKLLTDEQKKRFEEGPGGFGPGSRPTVGQLIAARVHERLKLTDKQGKELAELQKEADGKLDKLLKDDQKKQVKQMKEFARGFPGGPPGGGGPGGFPGGGFPGFGPGGSSLFRAPHYALDYPGLAGKELKAGKKLEDLQATPPKAPSRDR